MADHHRPHYLRWLRYYWDFCHKYQLEPTARSSPPAFEEILRAKKQPDFQRQQVLRAVSLWYEVSYDDRRPVKQASAAVRPQGCSETRSLTNPAGFPATTTTRVSPSTTSPIGPGHDEAAAHSRLIGEVADQARWTQTHAVPPVSKTQPEGRIDAASTGVSRVSVYDGLNAAVAVRHYSPTTHRAYRHWTRKFQTFTRSKDPRLLSTDDVKGFLTFLAVDRKVAASSQNQAFNALLFLFKHVLGKEFGKVEGVVRAKRRKYIPVVLSRAEVDRVIRCLQLPYDLVPYSLYGCGLRLFECLKLRVRDLNFELKVLTIHDGKGQKPLRRLSRPETTTAGTFARIETGGNDPVHLFDSWRNARRFRRTGGSRNREAQELAMPCGTCPVATCCRAESQ